METSPCCIKGLAHNCEAIFRLKCVFNRFFQANLNSEAWLTDRICVICAIRLLHRIQTRTGDACCCGYNHRLIFFEKVAHPGFQFSRLKILVVATFKQLAQINFIWICLFDVLYFRDALNVHVAALAYPLVEHRKQLINTWITKNASHELEYCFKIGLVIYHVDKAFAHKLFKFALKKILNILDPVLSDHLRQILWDVKAAIVMNEIICSAPTLAGIQSFIKKNKRRVCCHAGNHMSCYHELLKYFILNFTRNFPQLQQLLSLSSIWSWLKFNGAKVLESN